MTQPKAPNLISTKNGINLTFKFNNNKQMSFYFFYYLFYFY